MMVFGGLVLPALSQVVDSNATPPQIIVMPIANLSDVTEAKDRVMNLVRDELLLFGFQPVPDTLLLPVLREHRIRITYQVSTENADQLSRELNTPWILIGSMDSYHEEENFEVGLSLRLVNGATKQICWAQSRCSSRDDYLGILGITSVDSLAELLQSEIHQTIESLHNWWERDGFRGVETEDVELVQPKVMLLPFDNVTESINAGKMVDNILLSELIQRGYRVIEPGRVNQELYIRQLLPKGSLDKDNLREVAKILSADYCMTGLLSCYNPEFESEIGNIPHIEIEARLLVATSGRLCWAQKWERSGVDYSKMFHLGQVHTYGELIDRAWGEMLGSLPMDPVAIRFKLNGAKN
jgi:TolB-like protein